MNKLELYMLRKELRVAGASNEEARELAPIARRLGRSHKAPNIFRPLVTGAAGLAVGMYLIIAAQAATPTSWLFPVQRFSDAVAITIHPQYRASVMMKRAQQVNTLVARGAASHQIMATLADYNSQAKAYKATPHANYAAYEYCKTNLEQAANAASPSVRQAISASLQSLQSI